MSGPQKDAPEKSVQDFLQRWSRRKLGTEAEDPPPPAAAEPAQAGASPPAESAAEPVAPFDLASLPPIESIGATTDIRAFLAPGVPVELTRAALRRAWTSDPTIRDFVGLAENQWDFTDPDAVPGFGALEFTDEVRAMVSRLFGGTPAAAPKDAWNNDTPTANPGESPVINRAEPTTQAPSISALGISAAPAGDNEDAALHNSGGAEEQHDVHRKHGAALPK
jgi:hypothetical protein